MSTDSKRDALARGREEILDRLLRVLVSASLVPAIAGTVLAIQEDVPAIAVADTLGWLLLLLLSRVRGQVARRGASLVVILLVVGVVVVSSVGPYGVGLLWMVAAPSLGGVFFGRRGLWVTSWRGAGTSKRERASTGWSAGTLSEEAMAANELLVSSPPI